MKEYIKTALILLVLILAISFFFFASKSQINKVKNLNSEHYGKEPYTTLAEAINNA